MTWKVEEARHMTMNETILLGRGRELMSEIHHLVRYFVVRELPHIGQPISPALISQALKLPPDRVETILDELEQHLFFLVRNEVGAVTWAFPVTVEETPHHLRFNTGEQIYAA
jgi:hypothetical protein